MWGVFDEYTWKLVGIAPFVFCQSDFYVTLPYLYLKAKLFQINFQYFFSLLFPSSINLFNVSHGMFLL